MCKDLRTFRLGEEALRLKWNRSLQRPVASSSWSQVDTRFIEPSTTILWFCQKILSTIVDHLAIAATHRCIPARFIESGYLAIANSPCRVHFSVKMISLK